MIRDVLGEDRVGNIVKKTLGGKRLEVAGIVLKTARAAQGRGNGDLAFFGESSDCYSKNYHAGSLLLCK